MGKIRTVRGDVDASTLTGFCMPHEHIFIDLNGHGKEDCEWSMYDWQKQLNMLREYKAGAGEGAWMVDAGPRVVEGREAARLKEISIHADVPVVACTGFVKANPGNSNCKDLEAMNVEQVTDFFVKEIEEGMEGTDIKAGWIKGASHYLRIQPIQEKALRAGARASMKTGAPMHTHTEVGTWGLEQIEMVKEEGMELTRFGLAHMDRNPDFWYHKKCAEQGAYIIYDGPGKAKYYTDEVRVNLIKRMIDAGFGDQLMLCNDMGKKSHHTWYGGGPGWLWIHDKFLPRLVDEGIAPEQVHKFNHENCVSFYTLRDKK